MLISVVQNPALLQYQGKTLAEVAKMRKADPIETLLDLLAEDQAFTYVADVRDVGAGHRRGDQAAVGLDR